jgi:flagellar protein FlaI
MLQSLDILCIQKQVLVEDNRVRRANLIVEITGMDPKSGDLTINELYEWVPATDTFRCNGHSFLLKRIIQKRGWDEASLQKELEQRSRILGYMVRKNIRDYVRMSVLVKTYSISPDIVIDSIEHETLEKLLESSM